MSHQPSTIRHPDWESRLCAALVDVRDRPFSRADWDCVRCVRYLLASMTETPLPELPTYDNDLDALRHLRNLRRAGGLSAAIDAALAPLGVHRVPVNFASRGDILYGQATMPWLALHFGEVAFTVQEGAGGLCTVLPSTATIAWKIP